MNSVSMGAIEMPAPGVNSVSKFSTTKMHRWPMLLSLTDVQTIYDELKTLAKNNKNASILESTESAN